MLVRETLPVFAVQSFFLLILSKDLLDHTSVDVCQAEVASGVAVG